MHHRTSYKLSIYETLKVFHSQNLINDIILSTITIPMSI